MDSTRAGVTPRIALATDAGHCLVRCTAAQRQAMERLLYRRYPDREWGTFFRFGFRRTRWGLLICWVDLLPPGDSDLDRRSAIVEFRPAYVRRALRAVEGCELGVGVIHSHPEDCAPLASRLDDDMDGYFAGELERYSSGRPYVSLIIARDGGGRRFFAGRAFDRGRWLPVNEWLTCGVEELRRERGYQPHVATKVASEDVTKERLAQLLGGGVVRRLRGSTIGVIGCSGLGTPAVHVLARAGIGRFVLVDKGRFKASNHERNHASRVTDLHNEPIRKVDLLRRLVSEISPATIVMSIIGDVLDERVLDELTHCDLILGCTDSIYARAALGDIAAHYSVPVLDLAVQMSATDGRLREQVGEIARYAPGLPCPWCRGRVSAAQIREETMTDEERTCSQEAAQAARVRGEDGAQYWSGKRPGELTVGYMTTVVAAMGAGYAQQWLTGTGRMPHDRFQFDLGLREFGFVSDHREADPACSCQRMIGFADQGKSDRSVSKPTHWPTSMVTS